MSRVINRIRNINRNRAENRVINRVIKINRNKAENRVINRIIKLIEIGLKIRL